MAGEMVSRFRFWWDGLKPREQWLACVACLLFILFVWRSFVWSPLSDAREGVAKSIDDIEIAHLMLDRLPDDAINFADTAQLPFRQQVTASAVSAGLPLESIEERDGRITVAFETVWFDQLVRWLDDIDRSNGITVVAAQFDRKPEPGTVSARLELVR